jgi:hypothetical protein
MPYLTQGLIHQFFEGLTIAVSFPLSYRSFLLAIPSTLAVKRIGSFSSLGVVARSVISLVLATKQSKLLVNKYVY